MCWILQFSHLLGSLPDRPAKHGYFLTVSPTLSVFSVQDVCGAELRDDHFLDHDCPLEGKFRNPDGNIFENLCVIASCKSIILILPVVRFQLCCLNHLDIQYVLFIHLSMFGLGFICSNLATRESS